MERLNFSEYENCRQELLFECDRLAIVSMATAIDSKVHNEANEMIEDIREAWYQDTLEILF